MKEGAGTGPSAADGIVRPDIVQRVSFLSSPVGKGEGIDEVIPEVAGDIPQEIFVAHDPGGDSLLDELDDPVVALVARPG